MEVSEVSLCYSYILTYNYVEMVILVRTELVVFQSEAFILAVSEVFSASQDSEAP